MHALNKMEEGGGRVVLVLRKSGRNVSSETIVGEQFTFILLIERRQPINVFFFVVF